MIEYRDDPASLRPDQLVGFFEGWPEAPTPETHLRLLRGSDVAIVAIDDATDRVVGFVTAVTDGVLAASVPLLEVIPEHRGRGIGRSLMRRVREALRDIYMIDLTCDEGLVPFYRSLGYERLTAMVIRDGARRRGRGAPGAGGSGGRADDGGDASAD